MRVTICGHATLYVETTDQRILIDPYFSDTFLGGALVYNPGRVLDIDKIPTPTVLVVTHGHFDHLHWESLAKLPHDLPLITANDPPVVKQLRDAGFTNVITCNPWSLIQLGNTSLIATPSEHEEEEVGLLIKDEDSTFWHMVDSEVSIGTGQKIAEEHGPIGLISAKYQPSVRSMIGYLNNVGAEFDKREVVTWLETACICSPKLVFPYASGICFSDRHAWFNRYAFPLSAEDVVRLLQRRLGSEGLATTVLPGDVIELRQGEDAKKREQASPFVKTTASPPIIWEPIELSTLAGFTTLEETLALQQRLEALMAKPLALWIKRKVETGNNAIADFCCQEIVWQLVVHVGDGKRLNYFIDFRSDNFSASLGQHPEANFFTHMSGQTLDEVLKGETPGIIFWLTGSVRSYEKIMGVYNGKFWFPLLPEAPENRMSDPLTYYLRHFGTGKLSPHEPDLGGIEWSDAVHNTSRITNNTEVTSDIEVLAREGGNKEVMSKKALLTYLAVQEAERIGLEITDDEIQAASDAFRRHFGLLDRQDTEQWLQDAGLSIDAYSDMMRNLSTVIKLEKHYASTIEPLLLKHRSIATAQTACLKNGAQ